MSNTRKPKKLSPLREALAKKTSLTTYFDLPIVETDVVEARQRKVVIAEQMIAATMLQADDDVKTRAELVYEEAKAELAECFHRIYFRGLSLSDFDALVQLHPPTDEQRADSWLWNPDTFNYALIAACAVDSDLSADEWREELKGDLWTRPDHDRLVGVCLAANKQTMSDAIPKG